MLNSLKAISLGFISILILGLLNQLIFILASVGYNSLTKSYPIFGDWTQYFVYTTGFVCVFIVMASAGYITAMASNRYHYIHTSIAAVLAVSFSLYFSLQQEVFTLFALIFMLVGLFFSLYGCYYWKRNSKLMEKTK